ncbi:MAG: helix-turn-helix domain-containing protein [Spirochaetales bacterium]|nr:helix-turn-helix domain-containing protein [Spirochaetales bacterium]
MKEILKYLRQVNSFSQEQIAQKLGISRQSYIKYENGSVVPNNSTVHHLAAIYGVSEEFIRRNEIPSPQDNFQNDSEYKRAEEKNLEVASPEYVMKAPVQQARQTYAIIISRKVRKSSCGERMKKKKKSAGRRLGRLF